MDVQIAGTLLMKYNASNTWVQSLVKLVKIAHATAALSSLKIVWRDRNITLRSKIRLILSLVISVFLYACETWTLTADL